MGGESETHEGSRTQRKSIFRAIKREKLVERDPLRKHIKIGSKEIMTIVSLLPFCIMVGERSKTEGLAGS